MDEDMTETVLDAGISDSVTDIARDAGCSAARCAVLK
jgi:hypothetical protein